jgi:hypothetical protein
LTNYHKKIFTHLQTKYLLTFKTQLQAIFANNKTQIIIIIYIKEAKVLIFSFVGVLLVMSIHRIRIDQINLMILFNLSNRNNKYQIILL